jgi:uncharacterized YccA/Bax inhibitor family protein
VTRKDTFSAVVLMVLAIAFGLQASRYPLGDLKRVGPAFLPLVLAALLGLLALILFLVALPHWGERGKPSRPEQWGGIIGVLLSLFAYGFLLNYLGFSLTTFLFSLSLLKYGYPGKWLWPIGGALATTFFTILVFKVWLGTPFPTGIIGY